MLFKQLRNEKSGQQLIFFNFVTDIDIPCFDVSRDFGKYGGLLIGFDKAWLADEADLNRYLDALREAWLKEIKDGKRVQI